MGELQVAQGRVTLQLPISNPQELYEKKIIIPAQLLTFCFTLGQFSDISALTFLFKKKKNKKTSVESHVETLTGCCQHNQSLWLSCCLYVNSMSSSVWIKDISVKHSMLGLIFPQHSANKNSLSLSLANWVTDYMISLAQVKKLRWEAKHTN